MAIVWSGEITARRSRQTKRETGNGFALENIVVDVVQEAMIGLYPEAYSFDQMISAAFRELAFALPHKNCSDPGLAECIKQKARQNVY